MAMGCTSKRFCRLAREAAIEARRWSCLTLEIDEKAFLRPRLMRLPDKALVRTAVFPSNCQLILDWFHFSPLAREIRDLHLNIIDCKLCGVNMPASKVLPALNVSSLILLSALPISSATAAIAYNDPVSAAQVDILAASRRLSALTVFVGDSLDAVLRNAPNLKALRKLTINLWPYYAQDSSEPGAFPVTSIPLLRTLLKLDHLSFSTVELGDDWEPDLVLSRLDLFLSVASLSALTALHLEHLYLDTTRNHFVLGALPPRLVELSLSLVWNKRVDDGGGDGAGDEVVGTDPMSLFVVREDLVPAAFQEGPAGFIAPPGALPPGLPHVSLRRLHVSYHVRFTAGLRENYGRSNMTIGWPVASGVVHLRLSLNSLPCLFPGLEEFKVSVEGPGGPVGHRADVAALLDCARALRRIELHNVGDLDKATRTALTRGRRGTRVWRDRGGASIIIDRPAAQAARCAEAQGAGAAPPALPRPLGVHFPT
jgi:hypothetical protein